MQAKKENAMKWVFTISACACILAIGLICAFLFLGAAPAVANIGIFNFLFGTQWRPQNGLFGILPMILGSFYVTVGALLVGAPAGVLTAVYLAHFCPKPLYKPFRAMVALLAGVPSVVYGFFGLLVIVPMFRGFGSAAGSGLSILTGAVLLGIMIMPTIITVSESALRAVPQTYYEGALALGASPEQSVFFASLPAAKSGITAGVVLGMGRAVGEAMAVIMVLGNQARIPKSLLQGVRTLTANIVLEMGYAADLHRQALIATGVVLFVFILLTNALVSVLRKGEKA